ncbi:MAG TPA: hypothetical protein VGK04_10990, partial [Thermoanaerobaculia bacterium]
GSFVPLVPGPGQVTTASPYDTVTWIDTTAINCIDYNYHVTAVESCYFNAAYNAGSNASLGISAASNTMLGRATTTFAPKAPGNLTVDQDPVNSPCAGGFCQPHMFWPIVNTDTAPSPPAPVGGNPITIDTYIVERTLVGSGIWSAVTTLNNPPVNGSGNIEFVDNIAGGVPIALGQSYQYRIKAHSKCPSPAGTDSAPSVARAFPCAFATGATAVPLIIPSGAFDGDGSAANPWKVDGTASATVNIVDPTKIDRVVGRDYLGATQLWQAQCPALPCSPVNPPYTFSWTVTPNQIERLDIAVVDNSPAGCTEQTFGYFQDEPQGCCLRPLAADPTVVRLVTPNQFIDVFLKNVCSTPLTLNSVRVSWNPPGGGQKMDSILFPAVAGATPTLAFNFGGSGTTSSPVTASPPIGTATVPGNSTNYFIRVHFTKSITNPVSFLTGVTVNYTNATGTTDCPVQ